MIGVLKAALGAIGVGPGQSRAHRVQPDAVAAQLHRIQLDAHRGTRSAADEALAHALNLRDLLRQNGVGQVVNLRLAQNIRSQRENQNRRFSRIRLAVTGVLRQVGGQLAARRVDRGLHIARGGVDVAADVKLQRDGGRAQRTRRGHLVDAGDAAELAFQRRSDGRSHRLGAGAGHPRADADHRHIDVGQ